MATEERTILSIADDAVFIRHTALRPDRPTLLLLHGLGDSSLAFEEAFDPNELADFNVVAPDLPRHGGSMPVSDGSYTLESLASRIAALINVMNLRHLTVVGHSLSGDIATVLTSHNDTARIERIVNVEGTLTPADLFICN